MFDRAQRLIVLSHRLKDELVARGVPAPRIALIPPGVPAAPANDPDLDLRQQWGWADKHIIGVFGFIAPAKGHHLALEALTHLPEDYVLLIAGGIRRDEDAPTLHALQLYIAQHNLQARVRITHYLPTDSVPAYLRSCDVLVYPATRVDYSYSIVIGLSYQNIPIIASSTGGHRELADHCPGILLFENGNGRDLAQRIQSVILDSTHRAGLLENIRDYARHHTWAAVASATREVYLQAREEWAQRPPQ
jgi:glycosyltransferase involved in cell wall biosynthesis